MFYQIGFWVLFAVLIGFIMLVIGGLQLPDNSETTLQEKINFEIDNSLSIQARIRSLIINLDAEDMIMLKSISRLKCTLDDSVTFANDFSTRLCDLENRVKAIISVLPSTLPPPNEVYSECRDCDIDEPVMDIQ